MTKTHARNVRLLLLWGSLVGVSQGNADVASETVMIHTETWFGDVTLSAGLYHVAEGQDGFVEFQPTDGGTALQVTAALGKHSETIDEPISVAVRGDAGQVHVMVLNPDGTQREAVGFRSGIATRKIRQLAVSGVRKELLRTKSRIDRSRLSTQYTRPLTKVAAATDDHSATKQVAQQSSEPALIAVYPGTAVVADAESIAAAQSVNNVQTEDEVQAEYIFHLPLNLQFLPTSVEQIQIYAMLGNAPFSTSNYGLYDFDGQAVGWGQAFIAVTGNGTVQTNLALPVYWYGPGTASNPVPFPTHYVVYIAFAPGGGPTACGSNTAWESQGRCGTPYRPLVTGALPP